MTHQGGELPNQLGEQRLGGRTDHAVEAHLERVVGQQRDPRGRHARRPAESLRGVRVERPGVDDVTGHRHVADGEQAQDGSEQDEGEWHAGHAGRGVGGGHRAPMTVSGAAAEMTKNTTDGTPRRSWASAAVTALALSFCHGHWGNP